PFVAQCCCKKTNYKAPAMRGLCADFGRELAKEIVGELAGGVDQTRSDRGDEAANLHLGGARYARTRRFGRQTDRCGPTNKAWSAFGVEHERERFGRTLVAQFRLARITAIEALITTVRSLRAVRAGCSPAPGAHGIPATSECRRAARLRPQRARPR